MLAGMLPSQTSEVELKLPTFSLVIAKGTHKAWSARFQKLEICAGNKSYLLPMQKNWRVGTRGTAQPYHADCHQRQLNHICVGNWDHFAKASIEESHCSWHNNADIDIQGNYHTETGPWNIASKRSNERSNVYHHNSSGKQRSNVNDKILGRHLPRAIRMEAPHISSAKSSPRSKIPVMTSPNFCWRGSRTVRYFFLLIGLAYTKLPGTEGEQIYVG